MESLGVESLNFINNWLLGIWRWVLISLWGRQPSRLRRSSQRRRVMRFTLQSLCAISRFVSLCFVCLCASYYCVFERLGWLTYGNTIHLAINRCVFLCFCVLVLVIVCLCVWGWSLLLRDESNTLHPPIHCNCAQEEVAWGFSCRLCWHACAHLCNHYAVFSCQESVWVNLFVCVLDLGTCSNFAAERVPSTKWPYSINLRL